MGGGGREDAGFFATRTSDVQKDLAEPEGM